MSKKVKYHWSLETLLTSWAVLVNELGFVWFAVSYVEILATHNPSSWNVFKILFLR